MRRRRTRRRSRAPARRRPRALARRAGPLGVATAVRAVPALSRHRADPGFPTPLAPGRDEREQLRQRGRARELRSRREFGLGRDDRGSAPDGSHGDRDSDVAGRAPIRTALYGRVLRWTRRQRPVRNRRSAGTVTSRRVTGSSRRPCAAGALMWLSTRPCIRLPRAPALSSHRRGRAESPRRMQPDAAGPTGWIRATGWQSCGRRRGPARRSTSSRWARGEQRGRAPPQPDPESADNGKSDEGRVRGSRSGLRFLPATPAHRERAQRWLTC